MPQLTCISDGFHLVDVVFLDNGVKSGVEFVEKMDHLQRCAASREIGEAHDVTEVDCARLELLSSHKVARLQMVSHLTRHHTWTGEQFRCGRKIA